MDFTQFQPADTSSGAVRAAIMKINAAITNHMQRENAAKSTRDSLLIEGDRKALAAAEAELRTARDDAERLEAVADQLARRLVAAEQDEAVAAVNSALAGMSDANTRANVFWRKNGARLRTMLDEASEIVTARDTAASRARQLRNIAFERFPEAGEQLAAGTEVTGIEDLVREEWREVLDSARPQI